MTHPSRILICGAGIAGPACAWWLRRHGHAVVVAERAPALRDGGQNVDIKGAGRTVVARMGLDRRIAALGTGERGQKVLDADGRVVAVLPRGAFGCLTSDREILRGDLAALLFDATRQDCDYRFGTRVAALAETADGIAATFADGRVETFAAVVCAEGVASATRALALGAETGFRHLGAAMAFFRIPAGPGDDGWAHTVHAAGGVHLLLRPGRAGETTVLVTLPSAGLAGADGPDARKAALRRALVGRGRVAERVAAGLAGVDDLHVGPMRQVRMSRWSKGRFVLLGDAACCPTPFTGSGCAVALVGAYVLAGEIARHADHARAFAAYEALVRPYAEAAQRRIGPTTVRLFHPRGRAGIALAHRAARLVASRPVQAALRPDDAARARRVADDLALPAYPRPSGAAGRR